MALCQDIHKLVVGAIPDGMTSDELATKILREIATDLENPALFDFVTTKAHASVTAAAADSIWSPSDRTAKVAENAKHQEELNAKVVEAKEQAGDMEILDARVELSRFAAKSLTEADALAANAELLELPKISSGKKIDALMESSRVSSFYGDHKKAADFVEKVCFLDES
jgi:26S proteasome regulatory subunit N7